MRDTGVGRPVVAHYCHRYLPLTQTFMYATITSHRRYQPHVVSAGIPENLEHFPLPPGTLTSLYGTRPSWRWMRDALMSRVLSTKAMEEAALRRCERVVRRRACRVLHGHFGHVSATLLPVRRATGIPLVTNFYGSDTSTTPEDLEWPPLRRQLFEEGDLFLVEGEHMRRRLIELGCAPGKVRIQRIALRLSELPARAPTRNGSEPVILFAGRFVEKKGLLYALEAVVQARRHGCRVRFRVIGDGPEAAAARDLVAREQLGDSIDFLGMRSYAEYLSELSRADLFLSPSVTAANGDTEGGAPTTILDAQALGVPVVATTHADIPNVTIPGGSALLVPERDSQSLAAALEELIPDPDRRRSMGDAGREYVARFHDIAREIENLEAAYDSLLGPAATH